MLLQFRASQLLQFRASQPSVFVRCTRIRDVKCGTLELKQIQLSTFIKYLTYNTVSIYLSLKSVTRRQRFITTISRQRISLDEQVKQLLRPTERPVSGEVGAHVLWVDVDVVGKTFDELH